MTIRRRTVLTGLLASVPLPFTAVPAFALDDVVDLTWNDLIPGGDGGVLLESLRNLGVVEHGQMSTGFEQPDAVGVTDAYNGKTVRIPGFVIPIEYDGSSVSSFILVPFVGACIHVPPPPANQLVFVIAKEPFESEGLFEPVVVTGLFGTAATGTQLAEIGYAISDGDVEPYDG